MDDTALGTDPAVADIHKVSPYTQMISILYLAHPTEHPIYLYMKKGGGGQQLLQISVLPFLLSQQ